MLLWQVSFSFATTLVCKLSATFKHIFGLPIFRYPYESAAWIFDSITTLTGCNKKCLRSVKFWCGSGSAPLTNGSGSDSFLQYTKKIFLIFFLITYPQAHYLQDEKVNFFPKFCVKILFLKALFQSAQHLYDKKEGSGSVHMTHGSDTGGPKTLAISMKNTVLV